jgi:hypothetical protein
VQARILATSAAFRKCSTWTMSQFDFCLAEVGHEPAASLKTAHFRQLDGSRLSARILFLSEAPFVEFDNLSGG